MSVLYCIRLNVVIALVYSHTNGGIKSKCQMRTVYISLPYWEQFFHALVEPQMSSACTYFLIHHLCKIIDVRFNFYYILKSLDNFSVNMNCLSSDYPNLIIYRHIRVYALHVMHTTQINIQSKNVRKKTHARPYRYGWNDINILHLIVSVLSSTYAIPVFGDG